tara:strand:+ start:224 stop:1255 length:1032 start_codon:yes stop_codon:yes gene_type:complete
MSIKKINIAIIGATGFTGLDLVYLLSKHPKINIKYLCATKNLGKNISFFDKRIKKKLPKITTYKYINWFKIDLLFLSMPNGEAQKLINKMYNKYKHLKFIDLSADFRINNIKKYKTNYKIKHKAPKLVNNSIYGLSEYIKKKIHKYRIIANPGCYPTSIQIPLIPLLKKKLIHSSFTIDSKSGYSGAGKNLEKKFRHKNLYTSIFAYNVKNHRHIIEIEQELKKHSKQDIKFIFNPHLLPTFRGILSAIYVDVKNNSSSSKIRNELLKFYKKSLFIKVLKLNRNIGTGNILNTNNCEISICDTKIKNKIVIFSAIDNLVKGASGQAVQNMNLMYKFNESLGLK